MFGKASLLEHQQLRQSTFLAVVISTAAVVTSIIILPMMYSFVATFQSHLFSEIEYCKVRKFYSIFNLNCMSSFK